MSSKLRIIVTGLIAQHPLLAGVTWDYIQYAIGLARLGHDVYYFEDSGEWPYQLGKASSGTSGAEVDCKDNVQHLSHVMDVYGFAEKWAYHCLPKSEWFGLSEAGRREVRQTADLLINVSGTLDNPSAYRQIPRIAYIDSDPVFTQVKLMLPKEYQQFHDRVEAHDVLFSFGECIADTALTADREWLPTRQPIVLSEWGPADITRPLFTTVMSWTSYKPLDFSGKRFGQKDIEFLRFIDLPNELDEKELFEIALGGLRHGKNWQSESPVTPKGIAPDIKDRLEDNIPALLRQNGWNVVDPGSVGATMDSYRKYIESSFAEWSVAKHGYVKGQVGWFSCRSACYLAAGRPVIVQDTGFRKILPVGEGLLTFNTMEEAVTCIDSVKSEYSRHCRAASHIAGEYFDSDKVLPRFLDDAMNSDCQDN